MIALIIDLIPLNKTFFQAHPTLSKTPSVLTLECATQKLRRCAVVAICGGCDALWLHHNTYNTIIKKPLSS